MMSFLVFAHGEEEVLQPVLDEVIRSNAINFTLLTLAVLLVLIVISAFLKDRYEKIKPLLFGLIVLVILANTFYLVASTIYLNQVSVTGGPVHWHADFEIWNCGKKVQLKKPEGISNKIGSSTIHEHGDQRVHIEGVLLDDHDGSLGHFFEELGGGFEDDKFMIPTDSGILNLKNGNTCPDGKEGSLQGFLFKVEGDSFHQEKLKDIENYIISKEGSVPPGDCIILEFDSEKDKTDKLCQSYRVKYD